MDKSFKDIRIVDNFYQSSSFFPMPLCLIGTLDEEGKLTSFGAYSLCFPYYIAGKGYYAMILMDILMPRMNGLEATRRIRTLQRKDASLIPIIAMSANAFSDDIMRGKMAGMNEYLAKPLEEEMLIRSIRKCLK